MRTEAGPTLATGKVMHPLGASRYRVTFTAADRLDLPEYLGSTLRGAFGRAFRTLACPSRLDEPCPIPAACPYHLIFESSPPPDSDALRGHEEIPRPFVIAPEWNLEPQRPGARTLYAPGDELAFGLTLIGRAQDFFPHFVVALREMDRLGRGRRAIALARIDALASPRPTCAADDYLGEGTSVPRVALERADTAPRVIYDARDNVVRGAGTALTLAECASVRAPAGPLTIDFITQTRLKYDGAWAHIPEFHIVFRRLLGRLSSLARFHSDQPLDVDFRGLIDLSRAIRLVRNDTRWVSWSRYSSRQDRKMNWDGLVGPATYDGDFTPFWPFLLFGQHTHVGHSTTFGLGRYQLGFIRTVTN